MVKQRRVCSSYAPSVITLSTSLFCRNSSCSCPKRSPFTVGVCADSGHFPSCLHHLEERSLPKAPAPNASSLSAQTPCPAAGRRNSAPLHALSPPCPRLPQGNPGDPSELWRRNGGNRSTARTGEDRAEPGISCSLRFPRLPGRAHLAPHALSNQTTGRETHVCLSWEFILVCACGCFFLRPL